MNKKISLTAIALVITMVIIMMISGWPASQRTGRTQDIQSTVSAKEINREINDEGIDVTPEESPTPVATQPSAPAVRQVPRHTPPQFSPEEAARRANSRARLASQIDSFVKNDPVWANTPVGIYVATTDTGQQIYSRNGTRPMIPASNFKVVTSAAALDLLGPDYRFETSVWGGEVDGSGILRGNLYLHGTGDPTFMYPFTNNPTAVFHQFASTLKSQGVKVIEGDVVGDDSAFDREFQGRGWKERYMLESYAAPVGALSINGNIVQVTVNGGSVSTQPGNKYLNIVRNIAGDYLSITRKMGTDDVIVRGPSGGAVSRSLTVNNPSSYTTGVFAETLRQNGIQVKGSVRLISSGEKYQNNSNRLLYHRSPPLIQILREVNKESDNTCAFHVLKALGYELRGKGTVDNSNAVIKEWMQSAGIDTAGLATADGSGLSVYNRISPKQLVDILSYMTRTSQWKNFWASLPAGGVDGTMSYRLGGIPVRAKTGGLQGHISLSGYVQTKTGQMVTFSMLTNNHGTTGSRIRANEDQLVRIIAQCTENL
jgi:serine-type D-Ala-D-Ala carboxypeptidase/endopeptidase (penicillin-binding protein 4)